MILKRELNLLSQPLVSVIVPVYNVEKYLARCLDSILRQTLSGIEVICIDDGSTDRSPDTLREYRKRDARVKTFSQENAGLGAARNAGIERAAGEYLGFIDSDDFIEKDMFQLLYEKAREYDADIAAGNIMLDFVNTKKQRLLRDSELYDRLEKLGSFRPQDAPEIIQSIGVSDRIYKRSFIEAYQFRNPEKVIYEDMLFTYQTMVKARRVVVVNKPLYHYQKNAGGAITDKEITEDSYKLDFIGNLKEIKKYLLAENAYGLFSQQFLIYALDFAEYHQMNCQSRESFLQFFDGMRELLDPADFDYLLGIHHHEQYVRQLQSNQPKRQVLSGLPKKLRSGIRSLSERGFRYTLRRAWQYIAYR